MNNQIFIWGKIPIRNENHKKEFKIREWVALIPIKPEGALQIERHVSDNGVYWNHIKSIFNLILTVTVGRVGQQKSWFLNIH